VIHGFIGINALGHQTVREPGVDRFIVVEKLEVESVEP